MKVIVIGLGSMGKRRIRLLKQIDEKIEIIGVDSRSDRREEVENQFGISTKSVLSDAMILGADRAFVCTSPLSHADIIEKCLENGLHVFTEINLISDKYDKNVKSAAEKGVTLFLSSTFLYRDEIRFIKKKVMESKSVLSYTYHIGQYLPDWHPWENYKDYFVGDVRTNGCREIMAIDFPWIIATFGPISKFEVLKAKKTRLNTAYPDGYLILFEHENGTQGTIAVDVISRKAVRNFEVFSEDLYLTWNGTADGLRLYDFDTKEEKEVNLYSSVDRQSGYASFVVENAYKNEIIAFFDAIDGAKKPEYGFEEDIVTLGLIDEIEGGLNE